MKTLSRFQFKAKRNPMIDGRNNCGKGYSVDMIDLKTQQTVMAFKYNQSVINGDKMPTKNDLIWSILMDMACYDQTNGTYEDFASNFGYPETADRRYDDIETVTMYNRGRSAYSGCKLTSHILHGYFTDEEIENLNEYLEKEGY